MDFANATVVGAACAHNGAAAAHSVRDGIGIFHVFAHPEGYALIDGDQVSVRAIDRETFEMLDGLYVSHVGALPPAVRQRLAELGLLRQVEAEAPTAKPVPVRTVALLITQKCNFRCTYCYGDGGSYGGGGLMKKDTAFRTIDWLIGQSGDEPKLTVTFFGGEPLLNFKLLKEVVAYARSEGAKVGKSFGFTVTTNGSLLTDEILAYFKENDVAPVVSMDGPKELNDAQRPDTKGKGTYDQIVPRVKKMLQIFPETSVRATLVGNTEPALVEQSLREIGFKRVNITGASRSTFANGEGQQVDSFAKLFEQNEQVALEFLKLVRAQDKAGLDALCNAGSGRTLRKMIDQFLNQRKREFFCGAGRNYVGVSSSGDIYACHRLVGTEDHRLGSVRGGELRREQYVSNAALANDVCRGCFGKHVCSGGCYHDNLGATGSAHNPSPEMCGRIRRLVELAAQIAVRLSDDDRRFLRDEGVVTLPACTLDIFD